MTAKQEKLIREIFETPTRATIKWVEIISLLRAMGAVIEEAKGSAVKVTLDGVTAGFHKPHPGKEMKRYAVRDVRALLAETGNAPPAEVIEEEEEEDEEGGE